MFYFQIKNWKMLKILNNRFLSLFTINIISLYELIKTKLAILIVLISDFEYTVHCTLYTCTVYRVTHKAQRWDFILKTTPLDRRSRSNIFTYRYNFVPSQLLLSKFIKIYLFSNKKSSDSKHAIFQSTIKLTITKLTWL